MAWELVCRPVDKGGQGVQDIATLNRALMCLKLWTVIHGDSVSVWSTGYTSAAFERCPFGRYRSGGALGAGVNFFDYVLYYGLL